MEGVSPHDRSWGGGGGGGARVGRGKPSRQELGGGHGLGGVSPHDRSWGGGGGGGGGGARVGRV